MYFKFKTECYVCERFSSIIEFKFGIHACFLVHYQNIWKCMTPYDFCKKILLREWGLEKDSEFEEIVNDYLDNIPEEDGIRIVYSKDGYYPGNDYEK